MSRLIEAMAHDERVDLLQRLDPEVVESLLPLVAKADRQDIRTLFSYPEHSAGSVMTTEYATLASDLTVSDAISKLRLQATSAETIYYVYVVDAERHLVGFVSLHDLILARPTARIDSIMQKDVISVAVDADREDVAQTMARYDFLAIPVVDSAQRLVGIVTHDDVIDVVVQEATEDALRMGGVGTMVEHYLDAPFLTIWRKRSAWLSCLFVAELFTFSALTYFEDAIAKIIALSLFVPLVHFDGRQLGLAGGHADHPRDGPAAGHDGRLVARDPSRAAVGNRAGTDAGSDRVRARLAHAGVRAGRSRPLDAGARDLASGGVDLPVGDAGGGDAPAGLLQAGLRSGLRVQPVRGDVRRRDGDRDLLFDCHGLPLMMWT